MSSCRIAGHGNDTVASAMRSRTERPTPLDGTDGLRKWIEMFGGGWTAGVQPEDRERFLALVEQQARPALLQDGAWIADYTRLRVRAIRPQA